MGNEQVERIQCFACLGLGVDEDEQPCETCGGRGYLVRINPNNLEASTSRL